MSSILRNPRLVLNFYSGQVIHFKPVIQHYISIDVTLASAEAGANIVVQLAGRSDASVTVQSGVVENYAAAYQGLSGAAFD